MGALGCLPVPPTSNSNLMALELDMIQCVTDGCKTLLLTDTTGTYADPGNLTGWGLPNADIAWTDNASVVITITTPDEVQHIVWVQQDLGIDYTTDLLEFPITNVLLGLAVDETLPEGVYETELYLVNDGTEFTLKRRFYVLCNMQYKIDSLLVDYVNSELCNEVDNRKIEDIYAVFLLWRAFQESVACGAEDQADDIYCRLNKMLKLL